MLRPSPSALGVIIVIAVPFLALAPTTPFITNFAPTDRFRPHLLPESLQRVAETLNLAPRIKSSALFSILRSKVLSDQLLYVDLLAGVDVIARHWAREKGTMPTDQTYEAVICILSYPLPGCRPKSNANKQKILRARERLLVGAYGSPQRREQIVGRLTSRFLALRDLSEIDLVSQDIEQYLRINDLLR